MPIDKCHFKSLNIKISLHSSSIYPGIHREKLCSGKQLYIDDNVIFGYQGQLATKCNLRQQSHETVRLRPL